MPLPFECPPDLVFNVGDWSKLRGVSYRAAGFLDQAPDSVTRSRGRLAIGPRRPDEDASGAPSIEAPSIEAPAGACADEIAALMDGRRDALPRVLEVDARELSLGLCACGFRSDAARTAFGEEVLKPMFRGQNSYCSRERNPNVAEVIERAQQQGESTEAALFVRRNCTGQPANAFNKPAVDMGPAALAFARSDCTTTADRDRSGCTSIACVEELAKRAEEEAEMTTASA